ncbi:MAG: NTP transferase domain-containing protein [Candidatus Marinimicrobia bacterium]|nr:NTP transferase domain-containing protein [Candidatus Neomarinimicrobiota bacterium]
MQAVILCGGRGTRLAALYPDCPKALAPISGRPFLAWQLDWLARGGCDRIHLAAGHRAAQIADWLAGQPPGRAVTISREPRPLDTAGALAQCASWLTDELVVVCNGDSLLPRLDWPAFLTTGIPRAADARLVLAPVAGASRYGAVHCDAADRITAFGEKTARAAGWVNGGVYLLRKKLIETWPADEPLSLERQVFPALAAAGRLYAHRAPPPLLDMGTPDGCAALEQWLDAGRPTGQGDAMEKSDA